MARVMPRARRAPEGLKALGIGQPKRYPELMGKDVARRGVERMFPFVLRARILVVGRDALRRRKARLQFVLVTTDLSENSRKEVLRDFQACPVVERYTSGQLEELLKLRRTKVIGFLKSDLARSLYAEVKTQRLNDPAGPAKQPEVSPTPPTGRKGRRAPSSLRRVPR